MKLTGFEVTMYKGIIDSGWIDVASLTALVGKNEAGKTTLLKALHKLNPFVDSPYVMAREWPRGRRQERREDQVVCMAEFALTSDEALELATIADEESTVEKIRVTRDYAGHLEVEFVSGAFPDKLHPNDVDRVCAELLVIGDVCEEFRKEAESCLKETRQYACEGRFSEFAELDTRHVASLNGVLSASNVATYAVEAAFVADYNTKLKELAPALSALPSIQAKAHEWAVRELPVFIYMDDYRTFAGTALLDQLQDRREKKKLTEEDRTFLMILKLSGLDLDELCRQMTNGKREDRQYDLDDAGKTLTRITQERLKQREYTIEFRADNAEFFTMVTDDQNHALIRLEERSKGFQWFFSFDLLLMHESKGTFRDCVILLDEPGLHLHPGAQKDLLARLEDYAQDNVLIYSTHLPFMLDLRHPDRIRIISESENGAIVDNDLTKTQPEAKLTLQAALAMSGDASYLVAQRNLVVEGVDDFWIVTELSNLLIRAGGDGLPDDVFITPSGGASEAAYIATFMIGQQLDVVVLLDSDKAGDNARDKLVKSWLTRYGVHESLVLSLGTVCGDASNEFSIEDLFTEDFYLERVKKVYQKQLAAKGNPELALEGEGQIVKRVKCALASHGISFNHGSVSKIVRRDLSTMKDATELPKSTREQAEKLISAIVAALPADKG